MHLSNQSLNLESAAMVRGPSPIEEGAVDHRPQRLSPELGAIGGDEEQEWYASWAS